MIEVIQGQHPISIATSLALEGLSGIHPDNPSNIDYTSNYNQMWINTKTLFRNIYNAIELPNRITQEFIKEIYEIIISEMEYIIKLHESLNIKIYFYHNNLDDIDRKYKHATIRADKTPKQIIFTSTYNEIGKRLFQKNNNQNLKTFNGRIKPEIQGHSLILTHIALDLFSYHNFTNKIDLLESHTGVIKKRDSWYTKYFNGKEIPMIPFREDLIQLFGDKESIYPYMKKTRDAIIEIALKYNWSQVTSLEKINYGINQSKDEYLKSVWKSIASASYN